MKILITGATGYVGGRLVTRLLENDRGYQIRCMARDPARLQGRPWREQVEVVKGDVLDPDSLPDVLQGIETAYYLVHSLGSGAGFYVQDLIAAEHFGRAAAAAGVQRIIYLGGLGHPDSELSEHLLSRQQTGEALRLGGVPVTEFRAAVIVGSGSLSFEMIRYLTERLPIIFYPPWVYTCIQPIAIRNVLDYLAAALDTPASIGQIIEIGGTDVLTYGEMMSIYAEVRGLKRWQVSVPWMSPGFSAYWVHMVTPIPAEIARPLIEGMRNEVVVRGHLAHYLFPHVKLLSYSEAVRAALVKLETQAVETVWSDALITSQGNLPPVIMTTQEGLVFEQRQLYIWVSPAAAYRAFVSLGGNAGWLYMNWAWQLRGIMDRLVGGVGMRRGRRNPQEVRVGDALDFWRVEAVEPNRLLRLRAEMKVPGLAWLQFQVQRQPDGRTLLSQTAFFAPKGISGWAYWYALYPIHGLIFSGMIRRLVALAEANERLFAHPPG